MLENNITGIYDVIVVGGGHAGCEAAAAAANMGSSTLLVTMDMTKFASMSCNPAIGGIAKGQIVREIDALGGYTAIVTDRTSIQFRMLNRSKGPAMWSPRSQCDRTLFSIEWRNILEKIPNLYFWQDTVLSLIIENNSVVGITTTLGANFRARSVILTVGTFLRGLIHVGLSQTNGGRVGELSSYGITEQLISLGFEAGRMKTGTPARIDGRTVDFSSMHEQVGDEEGHFSYSNTDVKYILPQRSCYMTYTSEEVHNILKEGFSESPLFTGIIKGVGPRYCPSIEDKIRTFADKNSHHLFIEPEGVNTNEYYINGFSSSLPLNTQLKALRKVKGLENVKIFRPGYAIEYDYFFPTQLHHSLETKLIKNLFFAGQINGTTGYEEAAAQGLIAGINAHRIINGEQLVILDRSQAYIGVLIDDLVIKGVDEPYRMFTSRAEYRILLRQDNADFRLTRLGYELGLISDLRYKRFLEKEEQYSDLCLFIKEYNISPDEINSFLSSINSSLLTQSRKLSDVLLRPEVKIMDLITNSNILREKVGIIDFEKKEILEAVEIFIKYEGYIDREQQVVNKIHKLNEINIPLNFDYSKLNSLSIESRQKLSKIKPTTIGQASRIPGVSPSDISVLLISFGR
ncbi:MAG: tRNA uridine-5-carboxymethylaminomethyl(34) synthesis enzyme MnmG [Prevotellaceae bacterium]|jgi:tRNA uridine 5-carboxymethylaminomethyl modification enzyme|nr:tRNA uridine-5-carboxymethylaminomethyl(34) synthesis enzyme MnmG [Prevotellaceae bacterium]